VSAAGRRPFVAGNSKMNLDEPRCAALARATAAGARELPGLDVGIAPPFPFLRAALDAVAGGSVLVGAQDVHWEDVGAFTGEVSAAMLASMKLSFVIVGHSERRHLLGETDEDVRRKVGAAFRHGLIPIVCVGETEDERPGGERSEGERDLRPREHRCVVDAVADHRDDGALRRERLDVACLVLGARTAHALGDAERLAHAVDDRRAVSGQEDHLEAGIAKPRDERAGLSERD